MDSERTSCLEMTLFFALQLAFATSRSSMQPSRRFGIKVHGKYTVNARGMEIGTFQDTCLHASLRVVSIPRRSLMKPLHKVDSRDFLNYPTMRFGTAFCAYGAISELVFRFCQSFVTIS